jgi:hypothetical protein
MHKIYADLIVKGLKTIDDVPLKIRDKVKQELIKRGREDLAEPSDNLAKEKEGK